MERVIEVKFVLVVGGVGGVGGLVVSSRTRALRRG